MGIYFSLDIGFHRITGILPGFGQDFGRILLGFARILPGFDQYTRFLPGFTKFCKDFIRILLEIYQYTRVLLDIP